MGGTLLPRSKTEWQLYSCQPAPFRCVPGNQALLVRITGSTVAPSKHLMLAVSPLGALGKVRGGTLTAFSTGPSSLLKALVPLKEV